MLDLDRLADRRASALNQNLEPWRKVMWSADFQEISRNMSDGEMESLVFFCASQTELERAVRFILQNAGGNSPFSFLLAECEKSGLRPEEWIHSRFSGVKER
jgi:hypothetical protein